MNNYFVFQQDSALMCHVCMLQCENLEFPFSWAMAPNSLTLNLKESGSYSLHLDCSTRIRVNVYGVSEWEVLNCWWRGQSLFYVVEESEQQPSWESFVGRSDNEFVDGWCTSCASIWTGWSSYTSWATVPQPWSYTRSQAAVGIRSATHWLAYVFDCSAFVIL